MLLRVSHFPLFYREGVLGHYQLKRLHESPAMQLCSMLLCIVPLTVAASYAFYLAVERRFSITKTAAQTNSL